MTIIINGADCDHLTTECIPIPFEKKEMKTFVHKALKVQDLQKDFQKEFPGLMLKFYSRPHGRQEGSPPSNEIDPSSTFGNLISGREHFYLFIDKHNTVAELEAAFAVHGIHVQVFRRSAELWLQTVSTDDWSLEKQNRKGVRSAQLTQ